MRGIIKGVLAEELESSIQMKKEYEEALKKIPKGSLAIRKIRGHEYCYLAGRVGKKVKYRYLGKISASEKKKYLEATKMRAKYRKLLSKVKKQIKFLRSTLRGKEPV
ncbi:MAG: hypothetical protein ABIB65_01425 [Candidatus Margulisiibacteriota bacterium]